MGSRVRVLLVVASAAAVFFAPMQEQISAQSGPGVVISEFRFSGPAGVNDEFIELFNAGSTPVSIAGWMIRASNNTRPPSVNTRATIAAGAMLNPGCYYLVANNGTGGFSGGVAPDLTYPTGFADDGGVALMTNAGVIVDQVGFGANGAYGEGTRLPAMPPAPPAPGNNRSAERRADPISGYVDGNDNAADFAVISPARPQNSHSACFEPKIYLPHEIQGDANVSPLAPGTIVTVRGVVTARTATGFFMQTEPGSEDSDPHTSEGLFIASTDAVVVGHAVRVTGRVGEYVPVTDAASASLTQVDSVTAVHDLGSGSLPAPTPLTNAELSAAGAADQLERFEGMRVRADWLTAVSPTALDGSFYAVLTGAPRPFREPGVEAGSPVLPCAVGPCNVPVFDGNPERLRVDSDGLLGASPVPLTTGALMPGVTGVLDFASRAYTLLPESLDPTGGMSIVTVPAASADQFTVASLKLGVLDAAQLAKTSLAVRNVMNFPDVVGVHGLTTVASLQALAAQIDADAAAASQAAPHYQALAFEGDDPNSVGVGALVKTAGNRVAMLSVDQVGGAVHAHASLVVRAQVTGPATRLPQLLTVIVNQLEPLTGVDRDDASGAAVRAARQAQANFLADYVQGLQINNPDEAIVSLGGFNAFPFNDGYVDVFGTLRGVPASADQVHLSSPAVVSPVLVDADALNPAAERYSSLSNGNAQSLDHVLVGASLAGRLAGLAHARVNADFPHALNSDDSTPARFADRDPLVGYFYFPPDVVAPLFDGTPADVVAEATGPSGAAVAFATPSAHDNLDPSVAVTCSPVSGSTFPLGNSAVTCSAQDLAGNAATTSFTVTVQDTTAPVLTLPANIAVEAASAFGRAVSFSASASDAVSASPVVNCTPASGATFAVGTTQVSCSASDAAGNAASGSFSVTVTTTAPSNTTTYGRMFGEGQVGNGLLRARFLFDVRESPRVGERGWVHLVLRDGPGKPDRMLAVNVSDVSFSNSDGYAPGRFPRSGVDTVSFRGVGAWNGHAGYRFEITASDRGEPGRNRDTFSVSIYAPNGKLVESHSGTLHDGNIQSFTVR